MHPILIILFVFSMMVRAEGTFFDQYSDYADEDLTAMNQSLLTKPKSLKTKSILTSPITKALSTKYPSINGTGNTTRSVSFPNQSNSSPSSSSLAPETSRKAPKTAPPMSSYILASILVDQFNHYRNIDILSRVKQCDPNLKLHDMCEIYSFDNHTYSLIRDLPVEFQSLKQLYDALIDRMIVQKLSQLCPIGHWCLENLTQNDIYITLQVIRQRGRSFCSMENCSQRIAMHITSCPLISPKNLSTPTLKLLPMLCALYEEQQTWIEMKCANEIVYLLHILYAFWPQLETCYRTISAGSGGCTPECLMFDTIFHQVDNQCSGNASFLRRVPSLAWYRLVNLKRVCRHETNATKSPFVSSVEHFISSNLLWYRLHQRPTYAAIFIIIVICIVISFSACLYVMSKNDSDSNTRRLDDDYEYTRLHDSTFELGTGTEIPNNSSASSRTNHESQIDPHHRLSEHQRLLNMES